MSPPYSEVVYQWLQEKGLINSWVMTKTMKLPVTTLREDKATPSPHYFGTETLFFYFFMLIGLFDTKYCFVLNLQLQL